ncbi:bolA-like protein 2 isoform X3 [Trachypithecus francoisi]|uniref:bolA-like protein 2 isoform X3 n=1 Tax=Trachypithecus francoisi TaxID=54180 RepID=UPI00141BD6BB|nr:bolA-like protein 2 isoform X3 [Trachypithecus francoisi]
MASAKSPDRWKARLLEGGSAALTYALVRAEVSLPAEVAPVRLQGSVAGVGAGVVSPLGCRPSWTTAMELSAEYLREKLQRDLEAEHVLPSPGGVGQVRGETAASETQAGKRVPSRRTPAHPCL